MTEPSRPSSGGARSIFSPVNYGSQIDTNYGSITLQNYFLASTPVDSQDSSRSPTQRKYDRARGLFASGHYSEAKDLLREALIPSAGVLLESTDRMLMEYELGHVHFRLEEYREASSCFTNLIRTDGAANEVQSTIGDSRFWLALSFVHSEKHEVAIKHFKIFIRTYDQHNALAVERVTLGQTFLGMSYDRLGLGEEARKHLQAAYETRVQTTGQTDLRTVNCRFELARTLYFLGRYSDALTHCEALFEDRERLRFRELDVAAMSWHYLALCLASLHRYDDAEPHLELVVSNAETQRMPTDTRELEMMALAYYWRGRVIVFKSQVNRAQYAAFLLSCALGWFLDKPNGEAKRAKSGCRRCLARIKRLEGQAATAEQLCREALNDIDAVIDREESRATSLELAHSLHDQDKTQEALSILIKVDTETSSTDYCKGKEEDAIDCLELLGRLYMKKEEYATAREYFQRIVSASPDNPTATMMRSRNSLGRVLYLLGDFASAVEHFQAALAYSETEFGLLHPEIWLSWTLCELERFDEAETCIQSGLLTFREPPAVSDEVTPASDFFFGRMHYYNGMIALHCNRLAEGLRLFVLAEPMLTRRGGAEHETTIGCRYYRACSLYTSKKFHDAERMFYRLLVTKCDHPSACLIRQTLAPHWLGRILRACGEYSAAKKNLKMSLDSFSATKAAIKNVTRGSNLYFYGSCLFESNKLNEAENIVRELIKDLRKCPEADVCRFYELLGSIFTAAEKYDEAMKILQKAIPKYVRIFGHDYERTWRVRGLLADNLCRLGRSKEADDLLVQFVALEDGNRSHLVRLPKSIGYYWLGRKAFDASQYSLAQTQFEKAIAMIYERRWIFSQRMTFDCQHYLARIQYEKERRGEALRLFEMNMDEIRLFEYSEQLADNTYWSTVCMRDLDKPAKAEEAAQTLIDENATVLGD